MRANEGRPRKSPAGRDRRRRVDEKMSLRPRGEGPGANGRERQNNNRGWIQRLVVLAVSSMFTENPTYDYEKFASFMYIKLCKNGRMEKKWDNKKCVELNVLLLYRSWMFAITSVVLDSGQQFLNFPFWFLPTTSTPLFLGWKVTDNFSKFLHIFYKNKLQENNFQKKSKSSEFKRIIYNIQLYLSIILGSLANGIRDGCGEKHFCFSMFGPWLWLAV